MEQENKHGNNSTSKIKTMCFTGIRPKDLHGYDHDLYIPIVKATEQALVNIITSEHYEEFITGGAQGFDQLAFWAVNRLKRRGYNIYNTVFVPFKGQERIWKKTGLFSKEEYSLMLHLADKVIYVNEIDINNKISILTALHNRNHAMIDKSDAVFGLYPDSRWTLATRGGTASCLRYALSQNKQIYQLSNTTLVGQWLCNNNCYRK